MPLGMNAPKLWPALPVSLRLIVSSGQVRVGPHFFVTSLPVMVADDAVDVADRQVGVDALAAFDGGLADVQQPGHVEAPCQCVVPGPICRVADDLRARHPAAAKCS